ncbi:mdmC [Symbiodinium sp. CCMP2592]|nr:mdmC [Symbiodinium sp. CCMP2592]
MAAMRNALGKGQHHSVTQTFGLYSPALAPIPFSSGLSTGAFPTTTFAQNFLATPHPGLRAAPPTGVQAAPSWLRHLDRLLAEAIEEAITWLPVDFNAEVMNAGIRTYDREIWGCIHRVTQLLVIADEPGDQPLVEPSAKQVVRFHVVGGPRRMTIFSSWCKLMTTSRSPIGQQELSDRDTRYEVPVGEMLYSRWGAAGGIVDLVHLRDGLHIGARRWWHNLKLRDNQYDGD